MTSGATEPLTGLRLPDLPDGWQVEQTWGPGPFTTHALIRRPDGSEVEWSSRRHRKLLGFSRSEPDDSAGSGRVRPSSTSIVIGTLFSIGAICFAFGSFPPYFDNVSPSTVGWTFFIGSLFFTTASAVQFHETVAAPLSVQPGTAPQRGLRSLVGWRPRQIDWWAALVQLVGTVFFNVSTYSATQSDLSTEQARHLIWAPDVFGSVCFLIASWLAYSEVNRGIRPRPDGTTGWRIGGLNMLGSLAFGAAAIAARYLPTTGETANINLVNLGTFVGALCFLAGAILLPVESSRDST